MPVRAGEGVAVTLRHAADAGDLRLVLTEGGQTVATSDGLGGVERVGVDPGVEDRTLELRVDGRAGDSVVYSLDVRRRPADSCLPDALEGLLGNDDADHATPIGRGAYEVKLCPGDEDWFEIGLDAGSLLVVDAIPDGDPPDVVMQVRGPDGALLQEGGPDGVVAEASDRGRHTVRFAADGVAAQPWRGQLFVDAQPGPAAAARACDDPLLLEIDEPVGLPRVVAVDRLAAGCGIGDTADHVLAFDLGEQATATVTLTGAAFGSTVAIHGRCGDVGSEVACESDDLFDAATVALEDVALGPGRWFVVVEAPPGGAGPQVTLSVVPPCAGDDDCEDDAVCGGGVCEAPCAADPDCPGAQTCDVGSGHCEEPDPCAVDADCLGLRVCEHGACDLPECAEHAACPVACVDRSCDGVPRAACHDDEPCPAPQTCAPLGACVLDQACDGDAQCPVGAPRCDGLSGACVGCLSDDDCAAAQECAAGVCELIGVCDEDDNCPGTQLCGAAGLCEAAPDCEGDRFDALGEAIPVAARTYSALLLCDGTQDAYSARTAPGEGLQVQVAHAPADGDLALVLTALQDGEVVASAVSDGPHGLEALGINPWPASRDLQIVVRGRAGASVPYELTLARVVQGECVEDPLEGLLGNDDRAHATPVGVGQVTHGLCPADEDWFALGLAAGTRLSVRSEPLGQGGPNGAPVALPEDLVLTVLGPGGQVLARGEANGGALTTVVDIGATGSHAVRLADGGADPIRLGLTLEATAAPGGEAAALACQGAASLEAGVPLRLPALVPVERLPSSCGFEGGGDYAAAFVLAQPGTVRIEAQGAGVGAALSVRGDCAQVASELSCVSDDAFAGDDLVIDELALAAGTWTVVLETLADGVRPALRLTVQ